jgi:hypothetical protein
MNVYSEFRFDHVRYEMAGLGRRERNCYPSAESSRKKLKLISCLRELSNLNSYEHLIESLILLEHRY